MKIFQDLTDWTAFRNSSHFLNKRVGFVPTMGALHEGHLSLFRLSLLENDITVGSIFVNPTQFNNPEDLKKYPHSLERDMKMLSDLGVDFLINPSFDSIYPDNYRYKIVESELSHDLCGQHRPGHFDGVLTVVMKLFNLVVPDRAYFGEKDYQQYLLVRDMVKTFFMSVVIVSCPTIREQTGLAMSSRNERLNEQQKILAAAFARILKVSSRCENIREELSEAGIKVDYIQERWGRRFGAVHIGNVRLIDNVKV
ncbi:MAG: pantoate--beta-alanine ligase [Pseudomonadota bacterium]|nr:pantoate--beta-alanine ligase [Pseudomonadota bacterium]